MLAPAMTTQPDARSAGTLGPRFTGTHDAAMTDADRFLQPVGDAAATFWERWAAVRYVEDQLLGRYHLERTLLAELRAFLTPELRERLEMQTDRLNRLIGEFRRLGRERESARELAHTTRELLDALRLWYAEIEFAVGGVRVADLSGAATRLVAELIPMRCGWADANA